MSKSIYNSISTKICPFIMLTIIGLTLTSNPSLQQTQQLKVTVNTDKTSYTYRQIVEINGNVTLDENPVNALIGIEIDDPNNIPIVTRTISTGTTSSTNIQILSVTSCDENGNLKTIFEKK